MSAIHCSSLPPIALRSSRNGSSSITSKKKTARHSSAETISTSAHERLPIKNVTIFGIWVVLTATKNRVTQLHTDMPIKQKMDWQSNCVFHVSWVRWSRVFWYYIIRGDSPPPSNNHPDCTEPSLWEGEHPNSYAVKSDIKIPFQTGSNAIRVSHRFRMPISDEKFGQHHWQHLPLAWSVWIHRTKCYFANDDQRWRSKAMSYVTNRTKQHCGCNVIDPIMMRGIIIIIVIIINTHND